MATGFLLVCLLAGALVPKAGTGHSFAEADQGESAVGIAAAEGAQV
jgi:hypothetical protein